MARQFSSFERWQLTLNGIQALILMIGTGAAIYIGWQQTEINRRLYELNFAVAAEVTYEANTKRLNVFNKGRENIWLWGSRLGSGPRTIEKDGRLITPGGFYYLIAEGLEREVLQKVGQTGELRVPFEIYLKDASLRPHKAGVMLFIQVKDGKTTVHTQTVSVEQSAW